MLGAVLGFIFRFQEAIGRRARLCHGFADRGLAIELGFEGAYDLVRHGASVARRLGVDRRALPSARVIYYVTSLFLEQKGAAFAIRRAFWNTPWTASAKPSAKSSRCCRNATCCATPGEQMNRCSIAFQEREGESRRDRVPHRRSGDALYIVAHAWSKC